MICFYATKCWINRQCLRIIVGTYDRPISMVLCKVVDPQALAGDVFGGFLQALHDLRLRGHVGRVDVVDARADGVGVVEVLEGAQQLHVVGRAHV